MNSNKVRILKKNFCSVRITIANPCKELLSDAKVLTQSQTRNIAEKINLP